MTLVSHMGETDCVKSPENYCPPPYGYRETFSYKGRSYTITLLDFVFLAQGRPTPRDEHYFSISIQEPDGTVIELTDYGVDGIVDFGARKTSPRSSFEKHLYFTALPGDNLQGKKWRRHWQLHFQKAVKIAARLLPLREEPPYSSHTLLKPIYHQ